MCLVLNWARHMGFHVQDVALSQRSTSGGDLADRPCIDFMAVSNFHKALLDNLGSSISFLCAAS